MNFTGINPEILDLILGSGSQTTTAPTTDPTYSSGFDYARSIAGGIPASQMIASGVSYSPDQPGGYTQADLNRPVLPELPVQPLPQPVIEEPIIEEPITGPVEPGFDGEYDFKSKIFKNTKNDLKLVIKNYDKLIEAFRGTKFESMPQYCKIILPLVEAP